MRLGNKNYRVTENYFQKVNFGREPQNIALEPQVYLRTALIPRFLGPSTRFYFACLEIVLRLSGLARFELDHPFH